MVQEFVGGSITDVMYGNGQSAHYGLDDFKRLRSVRFDDETGTHFHYDHGANGRVMTVQDYSPLWRTFVSETDSAGRPVRCVLSSGTDHLYTGMVGYDDYNNVSWYLSQIGSGMSTYRTNFTYDRENKPTQLTYVGSGQLNYGYDGIGRIATRTLKVGSYTYGTTYGYVAGSNGGNTTALVASLTQTGENCSYTYTDTGLIASATRNGVTVSYGYDGLGQLIRVNDPSDPRGGTGGTTWTYSYDRGGNILQKDRYPYTTLPLII